MKAFCQAHRPITLAFLKRFPTPQSAREATAEDLYNFLKQEKYKGKNTDQKVTTLLALLSEPSHTTDIQDGFELNVMLLIPILQHIHDSRALLEKKSYLYLQHIQMLSGGYLFQLPRGLLPFELPGLIKFVQLSMRWLVKA